MLPDRAENPIRKFAYAERVCAYAICATMRFMSYFALKIVHTLAAVTSISGFMLRGYWMMTESDRLQTKAARMVPHIVDTVFLLSGVALIWILSMNPFRQGWLLAKFAGLIVYIALGTLAIKRGPTKQVRIIAFAGAISVFAYIVGVALAKSPASWLAWLST